MRRGGLLLATLILGLDWKDPRAVFVPHVYNVGLNGRAVYRFEGVWRFCLDTPQDSATLTVPTPDGPVDDLCNFAWSPSGLQVWFQTPKGVRLSQRERISRDGLLDGALHTYSIWSSRARLTEFTMHMAFVETVWVYVHGTPASYSHETITTSSDGDVDWQDPRVDTFLRDTLAATATEFAAYYRNADHRVLMALNNWYLGTDYARGDSIPRRATDVLATRTGQCEGYANLTQAVLARMGVPSRAVISAPCSLEVFGRDSTLLRGTGMHTLVEYKTPCGWGLMEPRFSDGMTIPQVRFASASDLGGLAMRRSAGVCEMGMTYVITDISPRSDSRSRDYFMSFTDGGGVMRWERRLNTQREVRDNCGNRCRPRVHYQRPY